MIVPTGGSVAGGGRSRANARSPAHPSKVYLPRNPLEVALAMREAHALKQPLAVRGPGDDEREELEGPVLSVARLDRILDLDRAAGTVTVEPGVTVGALESFLAGEGLGLKVGGDHARCVGSIAAGLSAGPSSHRYGLFADQVVALEQVSRDGSSSRAGRSREGSAGLVRRLAAGRDVTVHLTLDVTTRDKRQALLRQQLQHFAQMGDFIAASGEHMRSQQGALLKFARVVDLAPGTGSEVLGAVVSAYEVDARLRGASRVFARGQTALQHRARRLSSSASRARREALSLCEARYASFAEVEAQPWRGRSADQGARLYLLLVAERHYEPLAHAIHRLSASFWRSGVIGALALDLTGVRSAYLGALDGGEHCELRLALVPGPCGRDGARTAELEASLDSLCGEYGARRVVLPTWRADARPS